MGRLLGFGPYRLDVISRVLRREGQLVTLPSKAIEVLLILVKRRGELVSKSDLMEAVWPDSFVEEGNLTQQIHLLRRALQDKTEEHRYILTVPGRGYSFVATIDEIEGTGGSGQSQTNQAPAPEVKHGSDLESNLLARLPKVVGRNLVLVLLISFLALTSTLWFLSPLARYFNNRGLVLQGTGDLHAAMDEYRRALLLKPHYAEARYNLADAYEEIPDYDKAAEEYQKAIDSDITLYEAYNNLARLYIKRRNDPGMALGLLDKGMSSHPQEKSVQYSFHKNYGWANLELKNYLRAEQDLKLAIELNPDRGAARCLLAKVLDVQGRPDESLPDWQACLAFSGQPEVEPEWRNEALEHLSQKEGSK